MSLKQPLPSTQGSWSHRAVLRREMTVQGKHSSLRSNKSNQKLSDVLKGEKKKKPVQALWGALYHCSVTGTGCLQKKKKKCIHVPCNCASQRQSIKHQYKLISYGSDDRLKTYVQIEESHPGTLPIPSPSTFPSPHSF